MVATETFVVQILNGLSYGFSIALLAIGLTLVFGIMDIVNFAHGEFYMMGAYGLLIVSGILGNFWISLISVAIVVSVVAVLIDKLTLEPIRDRDPMHSLIVTFGIVIILQQLALTIFGGDPRSITSPVTGAINFGPIFYPQIRLLTIGGAIVVLAFTWLFLEKTRIGILLRATGQDLTAARLLGVPATRIFSLTFALSAFLAVIGAGLLVPQRAIYPTMGGSVILDAFIVVILGGLGSISGAVIAALLLGLIQSLSVIWLPSYLAQVLGFFFMVIVLLFKPEGIFGEVSDA
jgi:branched-subunit amino acid ABC-type transport system permease component